jgi:hypothetical protein
MATRSAVIVLFVGVLAIAAPLAVVRADPLPAVVHIKFANEADQTCATLRVLPNKHSLANLRHG